MNEDYGLETTNQSEENAGLRNKQKKAKRPMKKWKKILLIIAGVFWAMVILGNLFGEDEDEEWKFIENSKTEYGKRFDTTVDEFIEYYNDAEREEHGSFAEIISKNDFTVQDSGDIVNYTYVSFTGLVGFNIKAEKSSDKILEANYISSEKLSTKEAVYWSDRVLSCATKEQVSWEYINEKLSKKTNNMNSTIYGGTYYEKGIMYFGVSKTHSATGQRIYTSGIAAISKESYKDKVLDQ